VSEELRGRCWLCGQDAVRLTAYGEIWGGHANTARHHEALRHWVAVTNDAADPPSAERVPAEALERAAAWSEAHPVGSWMFHARPGWLVEVPREVGGVALVTLGGVELVALVPQRREVRTPFVFTRDLRPMSAGAAA